ncbi:MAG: UvrB/UvrC motif-containing protein [Omnitrophica bacterium]|nr:UvrB/UvrC motif-containing protein [Candidatus Omnitrophota bacterium]
MLCDVCHKNIATVHLTEIINEKVVEMHVCQTCAQSKASELNEQLNISDFLGGLAAMGEFKAQKQLPKCSACGFDYGDFKKKGRLGCGRCYVTFRQQLLPFLKRIHGLIKHTGKAPFQIDREMSVQVKLKELRKRLERAIQLEEYEEAARLRDEIKKLEKK